MTSRRQFMQSLALSVAASPLARAILGGSPLPAARAADASKTKPAGKAASAKKAVPLPAGATAASESDPVASAIGYKADVKDIDFKKYPQRKKKEAQSQHCGNCALYTQQNEGWGKCQMIANGLVNAQGWCGSWSAKS